ncbi:MAG: sugar phosphate isomerase/epimerase family protein [Pirellulales bacterium]
MKAGCLVVYTGARGGHTHNHARRLLKEVLKELLPQAAQHGVTLAVEPMHAEASSECTFLNDLGDALGLIETLDNPHLKLAFHTYHMGFCPQWKEKLQKVARHIAIVHLGDGRPPRDGEQLRTRLGEGNVPLAEMVVALREAGFKGYYDVELVGTDVEPGGYPELLEHSREVFAKLTAL